MSPHKKPEAMRCAVYTRKSTEEGLEQAFNTLDAQREAGETYIRSQRRLGHWYLDVLDHIFGEPATRAAVRGGHASNGTLMDHGWASLEYPGGRLGQFEFNLTLPRDTVIEVEMACAFGELRADLKTGKWKWRGESGQWREGHSPASEPVCGFVGMRESINEFITAIRTGKQPRAGLEVAGRVQQSAQLCVDAASG